MGEEIKISTSQGRSYTIFMSGDHGTVDDFELVLRGVCKEYNAHLFQRTLLKIQ
jgi:hypothetical protein